MQQPAQTLPALSPGTTLANRYLIQGFLGGGGFGHIYLAQDLAMGYRRAIKEAFCRDPQAQHQFRLEAEFLLNARHPNLVRGYSVFEQHGRMYLVMDYVDGHTLEDIAIAHIRRTRRPLPEAQVLEWILPICEAAHALHLQPVPIIHRDIKPANIKLSDSLGIPILIDLGLAKLFAAGTATLGAALAFTPGYAPPEQYQASGATDRRTDVYGLGATLFYLLTGYQPTEAPARLTAHALSAPRSLNPHVSALTEAAVLRAMALDPAERQQDTHTLAQELRAARHALLETSQGTAESPSRVFATSAPRSCPRCGGSTPMESTFCMRCGFALAVAGASAPAIYRTPEPVTAAHRTPPYTGAPPLVARGGAGARARSWGWQPAASHAAFLGPQRIPPGAARTPHGQAREHGIRHHAPDAFVGRARAALAAAPSAQLDELFGSPRVFDAASRQEAQAGIFAVLAFVSASLSLLGDVVSPSLLTFCLPALLLGYWSLSQQTPDTPREMRWLAGAALVVGSVALALSLIVLLATRQ